MSFKEFKIEDRVYLKSEAFLQTELVNHGFTTRLGGVSHGKIEGLNLGFRVGDDAESVMKNYELVAKDLNVDMRRMVLSKQTHTDNIRLVTDSDAGKGVVRVSDIEDTDGLITNIPGISLVIFSADCVPLLFLDPVKKVVAASHAGWRGTVMGIGKKTIRCMAEEYGCEPKNILVAIGPSIGKCCFEVDGDTAKNFDDKYKIPKGNGKFHIDLWSVNFDQIKQAGVKCENIRVSEECTICKADRYYSYRTQKEHTGRQGAIISLR